MKMNKIKQAIRIQKRIDKYDWFINKAKSWKRDELKRLKNILTSISETEFLLFGQETKQL